MICTSGTAAANFYPAVIEATETRIPLIILTADRPPELRHCHAGQTIDQVRLYGHYPRWQAELSLPLSDINTLAYLRQTMIYSWERSLQPIPGVVHLNLPFRDPLAPLSQPDIISLKSEFPGNFFAAVKWQPTTTSIPNFQFYLNQWKSIDRGLIIAGVAQPQNPEPYVQAITQLAQLLNWPILAEGLSPLRNYPDQSKLVMISAYDLILRNPDLADALVPQMVIQIGEYPTSKLLRRWLETAQVQTVILDPTYQNLDPLHSSTLHLRTSMEQILATLSSQDFLKSNPELRYRRSATPRSPYIQNWDEAEIRGRALINRTMATLDELIEPKISWLLPQVLPEQTPILIANSMPVRDVECFWQPNSGKFQLFFNRGANGIDGTLSTALGIAHDHQPSILLTGDLALLHDTNGFLSQPKLRGHLTVILINNQGGGIFEMLPIAQFEPPFEEFFATPQVVDFAHLCAAYRVPYQLISSWSELKTALNPLPALGIRVLEVKTNRKSDALWRLQLSDRFRSGEFTD